MCSRSRDELAVQGCTAAVAAAGAASVWLLRTPLQRTSNNSWHGLPSCFTSILSLTPTVCRAIQMVLRLDCASFCTPMPALLAPSSNSGLYTARSQQTAVQGHSNACAATAQRDAIRVYRGRREWCALHGMGPGERMGVGQRRLPCTAEGQGVYVEKERG